MMPRQSRRASFECAYARFALAATLSLVAGNACFGSPIGINVTDPNASYVAKIPACRGGGNSTGPKFKDCVSNATLDTATSLNGADAEFMKSFDAWNGTQTDKWTLQDGGALPG